MIFDLASIRRLITSCEFAAFLLIAAALALMGRPLNASVGNSLFIAIAIIWQCSIGLSVWVRVFKPNRIEFVDILGPALATGAAVTALGWFVLCRIPWMSLRLFAFFTIFLAIDGLLKLRTRFSKSFDRNVPITAISIAVVGLGYHRVALLVLGVGFLLLIAFVNISKSRTETLFVQFKKFAIPVIGIAFTCFAFLVQAKFSQNDELGFIPGDDLNFGEAIALGVVPDINTSLSPFTTSFRYHWLSHAWMGVVIRIFKLAPFTGPSVLVPLVVITSTACLVFSAIKKFNKTSSKFTIATIAAALILAGASVRDQLVFGTDDSTSNQVGTLWLLLCGYYLFGFLNELKPNFTNSIWLFLLGFLIMGTKGPLAVVLVSAATTHLIYSVLKIRSIQQSLISLISLSIGSIVAYLTLVSNSYSAGSLNFYQPSIGSGYLGFGFFLIVLTLTRLPILISPFETAGFSANKSLAFGATASGVLSFIVKQESVNLSYFATGAIALGIFFGGISSNLVPKNKKTMKIFIACSSVFVFCYSAIMMTMKIYFAVLPGEKNYQKSETYTSQLVRFQIIIVAALISFKLLTQIVKRFRHIRLWPVIIATMSATTFGVYLGDSLSPEVRQLAIDRNGLNGGPPDPSITARAVIDSAKWIKEHSETSEIVATNYFNDGGPAVSNLVYVATRRQVLVDTVSPYLPPKITTALKLRSELSINFTNQPNASTARALTDLKVDWFLLKIIGTEINPSLFCAETKLWKCEFENSETVVVRFLKQD